MQHAFLYNLYEHDVKFPLATLFGGHKHRDKFNFFSESELGWVPQDSIGKFTYICHFKKVELKEEKKRTFILIARDIFVALAIVIMFAKSLYIHESDSSIFGFTANSCDQMRIRIR